MGFVQGPRQAPCSRDGLLRDSGRGESSVFTGTTGGSQSPSYLTL